MKVLRRCAFCGRTDSPLTKEHVYPRHWANFFPRSGTGPVNVFQTTPKGHVQRRGANHQFDEQVRDVCAVCNNGWMAELDEAAKTVVVSLGQATTAMMDASATSTFRSWATKIALVRTLQDKAHAQQAHEDRFHDFYRDRKPFGPLVVQAARCEMPHGDNNTSWVMPGANSATSNTVTVTLGRLLFQVGIFAPGDETYGPLTRLQLAAVRNMTKGKVRLVRDQRRFELGEEVTETEMMLVREPAALIGAGPAAENNISRIPIKRSRGGSFGNPYGVPNINDVAWQRYGDESL
ncbi:hypothetical protein [Curtobacterium sp. B8]|uniref:hypothetical protein n=1 Tax=Curtobacterium sp. B8 TaxID=95611 RepID=UPI0011D256F8|nr:hypothetical protein [Curtobacterium sp. B8]